MTCGNVRWPSAGPTSTVPGMVQKNTSGCRQARLKAMLIRPLMKKRAEQPRGEIGLGEPALAAGRQDDDRGPLAANRKPTSPLAALVTERSRRNPRGATSAGAGSMRSTVIPVRSARLWMRAIPPARPSIVEPAASSTAQPRRATRMEGCRARDATRQIQASCDTMRGKPQLRRCQRERIAATFPPGR